MFGWFAPSSDCPIDENDREWVERRFCWLVIEFSIDRLRRTEVALPSASHFPEPYHSKPADAVPLLNRVCGYMDVDPRLINLLFYHSSKSRGLYQEHQGTFDISIEYKNLGNPVSLIATMAHELAHVRLLGEKRISVSEPDHERLTDLATVFFGMGVFSANAVVEEKSLTTGWEMSRSGYLSMTTLGYALAIFAQYREESRPKWMKYLRPDVKGAFLQSTRYLDKTGFKIPELRDSQSDEGIATRPSILETATRSDISKPTVTIKGAYCKYCGVRVGESRIVMGQPNMAESPDRWSCICDKCDESRSREPEPTILTWADLIELWVARSFFGGVAILIIVFTFAYFFGW